MNAVLLCPGPSLAALDALPPCDVSMAVNRAALRFHGIDWWATLDYPTVKWHKDQVTAPNLLSIRQTITDLGCRLQQFRQILAFEDIADFCPPDLKAQTFSATAGLVGLAYLGAKRIDVYGADWQGMADWDGKEAGENRKDERWAREAYLWNGIVHYLAGQGVEVHRHAPVTA